MQKKRLKGFQVQSTNPEPGRGRREAGCRCLVLPNPALPRGPSSPAQGNPPSPEPAQLVGEAHSLGTDERTHTDHGGQSGDPSFKGVSITLMEN